MSRKAENAMAFVPVPNTVMCSVIGELFGQVVANTLYFAFPEAVLASEVAQLAASVGEWAVAELCTSVGTDYVYKRTEAQDISAEGQPAYTNTVGADTAGTGGTGSMPGNVSLAVSFRTGLGGRSFRGRNYVPGVPSGAVEGNQCSTSFCSGIVDAYEALVPDYIADDLPDAVHVVVSRYHLGAPRVTGVATPVLTYLVTNRDVDSQRRRLTGRGT